MKSSEPPDLLENLLRVLNNSSSSSTPNSKYTSKLASTVNSPKMSTTVIETIQEPTTPQISFETTTSSQVDTPLARLPRDRSSPLPPNTPTGPKALSSPSRGTTSSPKHPHLVSKREDRRVRGSPCPPPIKRRNSGQTKVRSPLLRRTGTFYDGHYHSPNIDRIIDHWSPRSRRADREKEDGQPPHSRTSTPRSTNVSSFSSPVRSSSTSRPRSERLVPSPSPARKEEFAVLPPVLLTFNEDVTKDACYNCGRKGHWFMDCVVNCGRCGEDGHRTIDCIVVGHRGKGLGEIRVQKKR